MVFELCVVEFCSEILLLISKFNQTCAVHSFNFVWFQTKLHSTQFNYHYKYSYTFKCSITTWTRWYWHCQDRSASGFYISNHKWWYPNKCLLSKKIKSCHSETSWPQNTTWPQNISWKLLFLWLWKRGSSVFFLKKCSYNYNFLQEVYSGCECNQLSVNLPVIFFAMTLTSCGA